MIQSDNGGEFAGQFAALLKRKKIKQVFSQPSSPWTNANIERAWGTLKQMLYRYQTATGTKSWVKILLRLTENYNKTIHRSIGTTPNAALNLPTTELKKRLQRNAVQIVEPKQEFKVGDCVRLRIRENNKLEKAKRFFTEEVYKINRVINGNKRKLTEYKLENVRGMSNASDLLLSNIVKLPSAKLRSTNYTSPLSIPAQFEVDQTGIFDLQL